MAHCPSKIFLYKWCATCRNYVIIHLLINIITARLLYIARFNLPTMKGFYSLKYILYFTFLLTHFLVCFIL